VGVLVLVSVGPVNRRVWRRLGLIAGGLAVFNLETALVVAVGYLVFMFLEHRSQSREWRSLAVSFAHWSIAALILPLLFLVFVRITLGQYPVPFAGGGSTFTRFLSGYGGLTLYFDIAWILMLCHALVVLIGSAINVESLDQRARMTAAISGSILVWFGYFINRADPWNLWSIYFLYAFLMMDMLTPERLRQYGIAFRRGHLPMGVAILAIFLSGNCPVIKSTALRPLYALRNRTAGADTEVLSGVRVSRDEGERLKLKSRFLRQEDRQVRLDYFTQNMFLMPLESGVFPHLPMADAYVESFTNADFDHLVDWIEVTAPQELLFDDSRTEASATPGRRAFFARLKARLADRYEIAGQRAGWELWSVRVSKVGG
jgi:hypothetical protein